MAPGRSAQRPASYRCALAEVAREIEANATQDCPRAMNSHQRPVTNRQRTEVETIFRDATRNVALSAGPSPAVWAPRRQCGGHELKKRKTLSPEELADLAAQGVSLQRVAARYGYSVKSVLKMAQTHGIKLPGRKELRQRFGLSAPAPAPAGPALADPPVKEPAFHSGRRA